MTMTGAGGPACREMRQLLGVYVVGAIDPAERALVEEHILQCQGCRDELASLAGLPAMLGRVPPADVARLASPVAILPDRAEPSPEMLNSLLRRVAARRRSRMWRGVAAAAAAAVIAVGGTTAVFDLTSGGSGAHSEVAIGRDIATGATAVVDYTPAGWGGTVMRVQVSGIKPGTTCWFWVLTGNGRRYQAGFWTVGAAGYSPNHWYSGSSPMPPSSVRGFEITNGQKLLVSIPAT